MTIPKGGQGCEIDWEWEWKVLKIMYQYKMFNVCLWADRLEKNKYITCLRKIQLMTIINKKKEEINRQVIMI